MDEIRKPHVNIVLMIAVFLFLFSNTGEDGFLRYLAVTEKPYHSIWLILSVFSYIAPPLVFMAIGSDLLGDQSEKYQHVILFKILPTIIFIVLFSLGFYAYKYHGLSNLDLLAFLETIYTSQIDWRYRYLYSLLAFMLLLPLLRNMAQKMTDIDYLWLSGMFLVEQLLIILDYYLYQGTLQHNSQFSFFINVIYIYYPLMGYYFDHKMNESDKDDQIWFLLMGAGAIALLATSFLTNWKCRIENGCDISSSRYFFNTLIFLPAIAVYYSASYDLQHFDAKVNNVTKNLLYCCGNSAYIIYFFYDIILDYAKPFLQTITEMTDTPLLISVLWILPICLAGFILSLLLYLILFPIRLIKKKLSHAT